jgi:hypothetical protein
VTSAVEKLLIILIRLAMDIQLDFLTFTNVVVLELVAISV